MVFIGDIDVPIITSKDTSIDRDTIQKNFVDEPPQVYELIPDLESGTYDILLNENVHERNETLSSQMDSIRSLPYRNASECPIAVSDKMGYMAVDTASVSIIPSLEMREASLDGRFFNYDDYNPAIKVNSENKSDFEVPEESVIPVPWFDTDEIFIDGESATREFEILIEDGYLDFYSYNENQIIDYIASEDGNALTSVERVSPVRVFDSQDDRVYSHSKNFHDFTISNGLLECERDGNEVFVSRWDADQDAWEDVGFFEFDSNIGYLSEIGNYESSIKTASENSLTSSRGYWVNEVTISGMDRFDFSVDYDETGVEDGGLYHTVETVNGYTAILIREKDEGFLHTYTNSMTVDTLDPEEEYKFYVGFVPDEITSDQAANYAVAKGNWQRSLKQR